MNLNPFSSNNSTVNKILGTILEPFSPVMTGTYDPVSDYRRVHREKIRLAHLFFSKSPVILKLRNGYVEIPDVATIWSWHVQTPPIGGNIRRLIDNTLPTGYSSYVLNPNIGHAMWDQRGHNVPGWMALWNVNESRADPNQLPQWGWSFSNDSTVISKYKAQNSKLGILGFGDLGDVSMGGAESVGSKDLTGLPYPDDIWFGIPNLDRGHAIYSIFQNSGSEAAAYSTWLNNLYPIYSLF